MRTFLWAILAFMLFASPISSRADEGMWFLMFIERLNGRDMEKLGLQLTPEEIYSINHHSLKDAIVQFNGGCTASIISNKGLVLTNHHCGYESIAEVSSEENNHLKNGFWAKDLSQEIKPKELYVRFFVRMDNVTKRILSKVNDNMSEEERQRVINQEISKIQKENDENGKYVVSVRSFFQGNEFYYFVYQDFSDVRLVGTPPESVGKFGGDTDNWEWPRHTADFSLFRVYTDKNGNPASYSKDNIPLKPKKYLHVNLNGVQENDFAMIMGYPGRTHRWQTAAWVDQNVNYAYPAWVEGSKQGMDSMKAFMDKQESVNLIYASKYSGLANYWKNRQGMIEALTQHKTAQQKRKIENKFQKWANRKENKAEYGDALQTINRYFEDTNLKAQHDNYLFAMFRSSSFATLYVSLGSVLSRYASESVENKQKMRPFIETMAQEFFDQVYIPAEISILSDQLKLYATKSKFPISPKVKEISETFNQDFSTYVESAFALSIFSDKNRVDGFLNLPSVDQINSDPLYILSKDLIEYSRETAQKNKPEEEKYQKAFRKLVEGLRQSGLSTIKYPDANSTLRLTYGTVKSLPKDKRNDAKINYYTTFKGLIKKYKPQDEEFDLPERMITLYNNKDFGRYLDKDGSMHVNFLSNNDITGGNSGSPVMNGNGELIGLAFDGNIEAMAGDVIFDHKLQRTINVDIRYVLWVIDKFAGAKNIIDELTIAE